MANKMYNQLKAKQAAAAPPAEDPMMEMMGDAGLAMPEDTGMVPEPEEMDQMAAQGEGGDTTMGHLTPGEVVIPVSLLEDPEIMAALQDMFDTQGINMEQYVVGNESNSVNAETGYPEFAGYDHHAANVAAQLAYERQVAERIAARDDAWKMQKDAQSHAQAMQKANARASANRARAAEAAARSRQRAADAAARSRQAQLISHQKAQAEKARVAGLVTSEMARRRGVAKPAKVGSAAEAATFAAPVKERSQKVIASGPRPQRKAAGFYSSGDPGYTQNPLQRPR